jgi:hypothetical protein
MTPQEVMPVMRCHPLDACRTGSKRACDERSRWLLLVGLGGLEPPASSLSGIDGCAHANQAFALVVLLRKPYKDGVNLSVQVQPSVLATLCPGPPTHGCLSANGAWLRRGSRRPARH